MSLWEDARLILGTQAEFGARFTDMLVQITTQFAGQNKEVTTGTVLRAIKHVCKAIEDSIEHSPAIQDKFTALEMPLVDVLAMTGGSMVMDQSPQQEGPGNTVTPPGGEPVQPNIPQSDPQGGQGGGGPGGGQVLPGQQRGAPSTSGQSPRGQVPSGEPGASGAGGMTTKPVTGSPQDVSGGSVGQQGQTSGGSPHTGSESFNQPTSYQQEHVPGAGEQVAPGGAPTSGTSGGQQQQQAEHDLKEMHKRGQGLRGMSPGEGNKPG